MAGIAKPGLGRTELNIRFLEGLRQMVETFSGRRSGQLKKIVMLRAKDSAAAPTKAEFDLVIDDLLVIKNKINQIVDRLQD